MFMYPKNMFFTSESVTERHLNLRRPVYLPTAAYGHFGRKEFAWERTDAVADLRAMANSKGLSRC